MDEMTKVFLSVETKARAVMGSDKSQEEYENDNLKQQEYRNCSKTVYKSSNLAAQFRRYISINCL